MNNEKLLYLAKGLIDDVTDQKITGVSVDNTEYGDGSKQLSINIDYIEISGGKVTVDPSKIDGDTIKPGHIHILK